ncbi:MAG: PQQ-binding-like beta-propeller repeat protein [Vicinamibacterales bacterium]
MTLPKFATSSVDLPRWTVFLVTLLAFGGSMVLQSQTSSPSPGADGEWLHLGGDSGSTRYSPLAQITPTNIKGLRIAWRRPAVAPELTATHPEMKFGNIRSTQFLSRGVLYYTNAVGLVEAVDPGRGNTIWAQEPPAGQPLTGAATRGVALWRSASETRVFALRNQRLWALDAATGQLITTFGDNGSVDLTTRLGQLGKAMVMWNFAPFVCRDVVMVGVSLNDNIKTRSEPPGLVQAFDVRTGKPAWVFNPIPRPGELGAETWENDSWSYSGSANVWSAMSADEDLGYAYLPTGSPTGDMYGGARLGNNLFGNSIVCVKCATGERVWHFQTIHHDLWDWDNNVAPILTDITVDGKPIKAVVQLTKQAMAYVFDRVTGQPVWPIVERPVPPSQTPGERASPTQPFPTKPAPFDRHGLQVNDLIDFTPELRAEALTIAKRYVLGPIFTPPSIAGPGPNDTKGTLQLPGEIGGAQYTGAAFDRAAGVLYVSSISATFAADLQPGAPETGLRYVRGTREQVLGPRGLPIMKPPYGRIVAIDLNTGDHKWMVPNADGPRSHPALRALDLPPLGQPIHDRLIATPTMLLSIHGDANGEAATPPFGVQGSHELRAYDKATGNVLHRMELPAGAVGGLSSYLHQGKQYIVLPIGTRGRASEVIALSLP